MPLACNAFKHDKRLESCCNQLNESILRLSCLNICNNCIDRKRVQYFSDFQFFPSTIVNSKTSAMMKRHDEEKLLFGLLHYFKLASSRNWYKKTQCINVVNECYKLLNVFEKVPGIFLFNSIDFQDNPY